MEKEVMVGGRKTTIVFGTDPHKCDGEVCSDPKCPFPKIVIKPKPQKTIQELQRERGPMVNQFDCKCGASLWLTTKSRPICRAQGCGKQMKLTKRAKNPNGGPISYQQIAIYNELHQNPAKVRVASYQRTA